MDIEIISRLNNVITTIFAVIGVLGIFNVINKKIQIKLDLFAIIILFIGSVFNAICRNQLMFVIYLFDVIFMAIGMIKYTKFYKHLSKLNNSKTIIKTPEAFLKS